MSDINTNSIFFKVFVTSGPDRIVGVVGDPLQFRGGGEGVGDVSKVLQLLDNYKYSF